MENFRLHKVERHRLKTDGEGITDLVGLAGCPLKCEYCLNKELLKRKDAILVSPQELWDKLSLDYCYFQSTGGGVTFGGGEALLYADAISAFHALIPDDVHINIETSLNVESECLEKVMNFVDFFLIDIKDMNAEIYERYTNKSNSLVLSNLELLAKKGLQGKCCIRIPHIPGFNEDKNIKESIEKIQKMGFGQIDEFCYLVK